MKRKDKGKYRVKNQWKKMGRKWMNIALESRRWRHKVRKERIIRKEENGEKWKNKKKTNQEKVEREEKGRKWRNGNIMAVGSRRLRQSKRDKW